MQHTCLCLYVERNNDYRGSNTVKFGFISCYIFHSIFQHKEHCKLKSILLTQVFKIPPRSGLPTLSLLPLVLSHPTCSSTGCLLWLQHADSAKFKQYLFKVHHMLGILLEIIEERKSHCFCLVIGNIVERQASTWMNLIWSKLAVGKAKCGKVNCHYMRIWKRGCVCV